MLFDSENLNDYEPVPCRIKKGWHEEGMKGLYYGSIIVNGRKWAIIVFNDEPEFYDAESIEVETTKWISI